MAFVRVVTYSLYQISSPVILMTSFLVFFFYVQGDLTPHRVIVCMALIKTMQSSMTRYFNYAMITASGAITSVKRIEVLTFSYN